METITKTKYSKYLTLYQIRKIIDYNTNYRGNNLNVYDIYYRSLSVPFVPIPALRL